MKAFLALLLALSCIASIQCVYIPKWKSCGGSVKVPNLWFDKTPAAGQYPSVHVCIIGEKDTFSLIDTFTVISEDLIWSPTYVPLFTLTDQVPLCWMIQFAIPEEAPRHLPIRIEYGSAEYGTIGCTSVELDLAKTQSLRH